MGTTIFDFFEDWQKRVSERLAKEYPAADKDSWSNLGTRKFRDFCHKNHVDGQSELVNDFREEYFRQFIDELAAEIDYKLHSEFLSDNADSVLGFLLAEKTRIEKEWARNPDTEAPTPIIFQDREGKDIQGKSTKL